MKKLLTLITVFASTMIWAQTQVSGTVKDADGQPLPGANIVLDGSTGAVSDFDGNFSLSTDQQPPFSLTVSSVGFESSTVEVTSASGSLTIQLSEGNTQLDEIVVSASRFAQRIFESPVTVEKYSVQQIAATPAADFFNGLENLKGIQLSQGGFLLNQVITRGFGTVYNEGFVTLVDGMNNMSPLFGFAMGNLIGLNELDVQSVEVIPGPASALYGADAYKGIMFLNSKNPFDHEGISFYYRAGQTSQEASGSNEFNDFGIRLATKLSDKLAVKATIAHKKGTEWGAAEFSHQPVVGGEVDPNYPVTAPDYNGLNIYGERMFTSSNTWGLLKLLNPAAGALEALAPNYFDAVNSTGYRDEDLLSDNAENTKYNLAIHYRPNSETEISLSSLVGKGDSPLQGFGRYSMKSIQIEQHKLEVDKGRLNFKTYYTREQDGDSYSISAAAALIANDPKSNIADLSALGFADPYTGYEGWFVNYNLAYMATAAATANPAAYAPAFEGDPSGILGFVGSPTSTDPNSITMHILANSAMGTAPNSSLSINDNPYFTDFGGTGFAHNAARGIANQGMFQTGTSDFDDALSRYTKANLPVVAGGSGIFDDTKTYNFELNYDLTDVVDFADFLVGASYRMTELNSAGTIYADQDGPIEYFDYGAYVQGVKKLFNDKVTFTGSIRLDKAEFFDSNFTPRLAALINLSENQNLRFSYQTGFRNPTNQDQYIGLFAGDVTLFGTSPDNIDRYNGTVVLTNGSVATFTGDFVFNNSYNEDGTSSDLKHVSSEKVTSIDLGYRFNSNTTSFDISAYYSDFDNKIGSTNVYVPSLVDGSITMDNYRALGSYAIYQADSNSDEDLKTYGLSVEFVQALTDKLMFNLIYDYNKLDFKPDPSSDFEAAFNTPEHNIKGGIVGKLSNAISYNLSARYNSEYYYEASFIDGMIDSKTVLDAQVSFDLTDINAVLKVGGNNIGGKDYQSVLGGGNIGSVYYTSITFDF